MGMSECIISKLEFSTIGKKLEKVSKKVTEVLTLSKSITERDLRYVRNQKYEKIKIDPSFATQLYVIFLGKFISRQRKTDLQKLNK